MQSATSDSSIRQTRCALPLKRLSEIQPAQSIPAHPATSKMPIVHPASSDESGTARCCRNVGPQSRMAKRTT